MKEQALLTHLTQWNQFPQFPQLFFENSISVVVEMIRSVIANKSLLNFFFYLQILRQKIYIAIYTSLCVNIFIYVRLCQSLG